MKTRIFGKTNVAVSEVGIGTWQFGPDWGQPPEQQCLDALAASADHGVTFIDTADIYGAGRSETIIGKFLKHRREHFYIATKLGRFKGYPDGYSLELFRSCVEDSLERLGIDALDLVQLHCVPIESLQRGDVFDWLSTLKKEGKIKAYGASVETMDEALACFDDDELASLQIIFNILRQNPIDILFDKAKAAGVALIIRLPLASGLLAGKFDRNTTFPKEDHRNYNRDGEHFNVGETFSGVEFEKGLDLVEQIRPLVPVGVSMAQFALRFCLDYDAVSVLIPGANKVSQAESNALASDLAPLSAKTHQTLAQLYDEQIETLIRGVY